MLKIRTSAKEFMLASLTPSPERPLVFYLAGLCLTVLATSWIADGLKDNYQPVYGWLVLSGGWIVACLVVYVIYRIYMKTDHRRKRYEIDVEASETITPRKGLILLLSPFFKLRSSGDVRRIFCESLSELCDRYAENKERNETDDWIDVIWTEWIRAGMPSTWSEMERATYNLVPPLRALKMCGEKLVYCWLIATNDSRGAAPLVEVVARKMGIVRADTTIFSGAKWSIPGKGNKSILQETFRVVSSIYDDAREKYRIGDDEIACDVTGAQKLHSIGAALACLPQNRSIEYYGGEPVEPIEARYVVEVFKITL